MTSAAPLGAWRRFVRFVLPPLSYGLVLLALSSVPARTAPNVSGADKLVHFALYAGLSALMARALRGYGLRPAAAAGWGFGLATLFGVADELHQLMTPGRMRSWTDLGANAFGAAFGARVWHRTAGPSPTAGAREGADGEEPR